MLLASKGGAKTHPAWYHNLVKNPEVDILKGGEKRSYTAVVTEGEQREEMWAWLLERWSGFGVYQERAGKRIMPVVLLKPL